jgi:hypothetical protein
MYAYGNIGILADSLSMGANAGIEAGGEISATVNAFTPSFSSTNDIPTLRSSVGILFYKDNATTITFPSGTASRPFMQAPAVYLQGAGGYNLGVYAIKTRYLNVASGLSLTGVATETDPHIFGLDNGWFGTTYTPETWSTNPAWPHTSVLLASADGRLWPSQGVVEEDPVEPEAPVIPGNEQDELIWYLYRYLGAQGQNPTYNAGSLLTSFNNFITLRAQMSVNNGEDLLNNTVLAFDFAGAEAALLLGMRSSKGEGYQIAMTGSEFKQRVETLYMTQYLTKAGQTPPSGYDALKAAYNSAFNIVPPSKHCLVYAA